MSWLSELKWSNRDEHLDAMLTGDAELDESVVSTYDRPQGFKFKLAQRLAAGLLPAVGANDKGKTLQTNETTGAPEWAEASGGGGGVTVVTFTQSGDAKGNTKGSGDASQYQADKTVAQIKEAFLSGSVVFDLTAVDGGQYICTGVVLDMGDYFFAFGAEGAHTDPTSQLTDYPTYAP